MKILALAVLMAASASVCASDWITASVASYHFKRHGQNERNPGLGVELQVDERWRVMGGAYDNSASRLTAYAGGLYSLTSVGPVRVGVMGGLFTGYGPAPVPVVGPVLSIEGRAAGANVVVIPGAGGVIGFQLKFSF